MISPPVAGPAATATNPRTLVDDNLFVLLVGDLTRSHGHTAELADRIIVQTLGFLYTCARNPGARLGPSQTVDDGWHAFLTRTRAYADFCERVAGRFIHHAPDTPPGISAAEYTQRIGATVAAMRQAGVPVDIDLWSAPAECSQCYAGCVDDPKGATL